MIGLFDETSYSPYYIDYLNMDKLNSLLLKPEISAVAELRLFVTELVWMATHLPTFPFLLPLCSGFGFILSAYYSIWLFNRICFGELKEQIVYIDLTYYECFLLSVLLFLNIYFGLFPYLSWVNQII